VSRRHQRIFISIGHELLGLFENVISDQAFGILYPRRLTLSFVSPTLSIAAVAKIHESFLSTPIARALATYQPRPRRRHGAYPSSQARA
jgi:hypothetical protein